MTALAALGIELGLHPALPGQRLDPADELVARHWHCIGRKRPACKSQSTALWFLRGCPQDRHAEAAARWRSPSARRQKMRHWLVALEQTTPCNSPPNKSTASTARPQVWRIAETPTWSPPPSAIWCRVKCWTARAGTPSGQAAAGQTFGGDWRLPLGLAHGVKLLRAVAQGQALSWDDVAVDTGSSTFSTRWAMEEMFEAGD